MIGFRSIRDVQGYTVRLEGVEKLAKLIKHKDNIALIG